MAKYKLFDIVKFKNLDKSKQGEILAVNDFFGNIEKPNYEVYVENEKCLYKEVKEAYIVELIKENKEKHDAKLKELVEEYKKQGLVEGRVDKEGRTILPKEEYKNW